MRIETITPKEFFKLSTQEQYEIINSSNVNDIMRLAWTIESERKTLYDAIVSIHQS